MPDAVIRDIKLLGLLDKYLAPEDASTSKVSEILTKLAANINKPEWIVPVLGSQGMGKSTLINAILGENILPNDADETTCVPVEIKYGTGDRAVVHFQSGDIKKINSSCESLREYVDNNFNPGNEKQVSHIELESSNELLKTGLVIVDLPGIGSLTPNNQKTTLRYIKNLCTAVFVIPTVPTIRKTEEIFIKGAWSCFSSAIFVQNRWDDETDREVEQAVEFNTLVLKDIAKKANIAFNDKIYVVNAYKAIVGYLKKADKQIKESNLPELLNKLNMLSENRLKYEKINFNKKTLSYIETVEAIIKQYLNESKMTKEQLEAEHDRIMAEFKKGTDEIEALVNEMLQIIKENEDSSGKFIKKLSKDAEENLRADIRRLIDGGIVDGDQLSEAFHNNQEKYLYGAIDEHYDHMNDVAYKLGKKLEELCEKVVVEKSNSFDAMMFNKQEALKYEKGIEIGFNIGGALGGYYVGSVVAAAVEGMITGSAAGPIGAVAGFVAGCVVAAIGNFIGSKSKKGILSRRAAHTKREIEPYIKDFGKNIQSALSIGTNRFYEDMKNALNDYVTVRKDYYKKMADEEARIADEKHRYKYDDVEIGEDLKYIVSKKVGLS